MKNLIITIIIIILVVLFGTVPISILSKICEYVAVALKWLAGTLDLFGWNGII